MSLPGTGSRRTWTKVLRSDGLTSEARNETPHPVGGHASADGAEMLNPWKWGRSGWWWKAPGLSGPVLHRDENYADWRSSRTAV